MYLVEKMANNPHIMRRILKALDKLGSPLLMLLIALSRVAHW